jgi:hypothetical protein
VRVERELASTRNERQQLAENRQQAAMELDDWLPRREEAQMRLEEAQMALEDGADLLPAPKPNSAPRTSCKGKCWHSRPTSPANATWPGKRRTPARWNSWPAASKPCNAS